MEVILNYDKLIDIWDNEFAEYFADNERLYELILTVELAFNAWEDDDLKLLYITLYLDKTDFEWLKESEITGEMGHAINKLAGPYYPGWAIKWCFFEGEPDYSDE